MYNNCRCIYKKSRLRSSSRIKVSICQISRKSVEQFNRERKQSGRLTLTFMIFLSGIVCYWIIFLIILFMFNSATSQLRVQFQKVSIAILVCNISLLARCHRDIKLQRPKYLFKCRYGVLNANVWSLIYRVFTLLFLLKTYRIYSSWTSSVYW